MMKCWSKHERFFAQRLNFERVSTSVYSEGGAVFSGKVVGVDRLANVEFEKVFRQYGVYDEWDWLSLVLSSLVHFLFRNRWRVSTQVAY